LPERHAEGVVGSIDATASMRLVTASGPSMGNRSQREQAPASRRDPRVAGFDTA
jgi:hypothetical protein